jgi:hypothetical protein
MIRFLAAWPSRLAMSLLKRGGVLHRVLSTLDFRRSRVLMIGTVVLRFFVYEEAHRRSAKRARLEL